VGNRDLVGYRFEALIGEPRSFRSEAGANMLTGIVTGYRKGEDHDTLFAICGPFNFKGQAISKIEIRARYQGDREYFPEVGANLTFMRNGADIELTEIDSLSLREVSWLIGTVRFYEDIEDM
jgi:hypothetical protein